MNTLFIGQKIIRLMRTDSTNSHLTNLLNEAIIPEGTIVIAEKQERGRGQRGTFWESETGKNLTLSILLKPSFLNPDEQFMLNKVIALGVMEFVASSRPLPFAHGSEEFGKVKIKWPNDIYIGNKKIAGILIENSVSGIKIQHTIVGIGVNVNQEEFSSALPNPVSLKIISEKKFDLNVCLSQLCSCIEKRYLQLKANQFGKISDDYLKVLYLFGKWGIYKFKGENIKAKISGITKTGKLMIETTDRKIHECDFKEVEFDTIQQKKSG